MFFSDCSFCLAASGQSASAAENTTANTTSNQVSNQTEASGTTAFVWDENAPEIKAESAIVMEASTGAILYEKDPDKILYPASLTKIMTCLLALENCSLTDVVTFSSDAVKKTEGSSAGIKIGEKLTLKDCLYGLMLASANEIAYAIAEHVGGTYDAFVQMMNDKAASLGCTHTHFSNPHGLFDENHTTTAHDLALISQAALKNTEFRKIVSTKYYVIPKTEMTNETRYISNHQEMLTGYKFPKYKYDGCIGGKTGYTDLAGYNLATFVDRNGMELISIVLRSDSPYAAKNQYTDSISLLDYCFSRFQISKLSDYRQTLDSSEYGIFSAFNNVFDEGSSELQISGSGNIVLPQGVSFSDVTQTLTPLKQPSALNSDGTAADTESGNTASDTSGSADAAAYVVGSISYTYQGHVLGSSDIIFTPPSQDSLLVSGAKEPVIEETSTVQNILAGHSHLWLIILIAVLVCLLIAGLILYYIKIFLPRRRRLSYRADHYAKRRRRAQSHWDQNRFNRWK